MTLFHIVSSVVVIFSQIKPASFVVLVLFTTCIHECGYPCWRDSYTLVVLDRNLVTIGHLPHIVQ